MTYATITTCETCNTAPAMSGSIICAECNITQFERERMAATAVRYGDAGRVVELARGFVAGIEAEGRTIYRTWQDAGTEETRQAWIAQQTREADAHRLLSHTVNAQCAAFAEHDLAVIAVYARAGRLHTTACLGYGHQCTNRSQHTASAKCGAAGCEQYHRFIH